MKTKRSESVFTTKDLLFFSLCNVHLATNTLNKATALQTASKLFVLSPSPRSYNFHSKFDRKNFDAGQTSILLNCTFP